MIKVILPVVELTDEQRLQLEYMAKGDAIEVQQYDYTFYRIDCITTSMFDNFTSLYCGENMFTIGLPIEEVEKIIDEARKKFFAGVN